MRKSIFTSFFFLFCISSSLLGSEVMIIGIEVQGLHQKDRKGVYDQIITETVVKARLAILNVYPPARAARNFSNCQNCCFSPANENPEFYEFGENVVQTDPMNFAKIYIFVPPGKSPISHLEDLLSKKVGVRRGMPYGKSFENIKIKLKTVTVTNLKQNIRLIQAGRIDVFIAYVPDAYKIFRELSLKPFPHDVSHPIAVHQDRMVCKGVKPEFIAKFNEILNQMRTSGRLEQILGENYISE